MINLSRAVSTPVNFCFSAAPGSTFSDVKIVKDGTLQMSLAFTLLEIAASVYSFTFTPPTTGTYFISAGAELRGCIEVLDKTILTYLRNIEDEALGSWSWNKTTGVLTMFRQNGSSLATFDVKEDLTLASRERT